MQIGLRFLKFRFYFYTRSLKYRHLNQVFLLMINPFWISYKYTWIQSVISDRNININEKKKIHHTKRISNLKYLLSDFAQPDMSSKSTLCTFCLIPLKYYFCLILLKYYFCFKVTLQFMELYNEEILDLFDPSTSKGIFIWYFFLIYSIFI